VPAAPLDVTDESSMRTAVEEWSGRRAPSASSSTTRGYSLSGAVESASLEDARRQFETNVFGLARLTQLVLPAMRREVGAGSSTSARWAGA
jgi:NAD(P)-dependent dehydrogenase (short-subunit alcohol dehydrogenase family)